jgi:heat shock protein 4
LLIVFSTQVINECSEAENWLRDRKQQQDALPKFANPVLLVSDLKKKAETLDRFVVKDTNYSLHS